MSDKNADGRAGQEDLSQPSPYRAVASMTIDTTAHAAGPDEALIEEIAEQSFKRWYDGEFNQAEATKWAIREYIRRSAGKEKKCST